MGAAGRDGDERISTVPRWVRMLGGLLSIFALGVFIPSDELDGGEAIQVVAALAAVATFVLLTYRRGVRFDARSRKILRDWGVVFSFSERAIGVPATSWVVLSQQTTGSGNNKHEVFRVSLSDEGADVHVVDDRRYPVGRRIAENAGVAFGLGLRDRTGPEERVREAGTLDQTLTDRLRSEPRVATPDAGAEGALPERSEGTGVVVDLGFAGLSLGGLIAVSLFCALVGVAIYFFNIGWLMGIGAFVGAFVWFGSLWSFATRHRETLRLGHDAMELERSYRVGTRMERIAFSALEELALGRQGGGNWDPEHGVTAISDDTLIAFGRELTAEQRGWLIARMKAHLCRL